ncbi:MAG: hypothetical protein RL208_785 [Pseudomonadota bacterium]|jgi:hypothetical protein
MNSVNQYGDNKTTIRYEIQQEKININNKQVEKNNVVFTDLNNREGSKKQYELEKIKFKVNDIGNYAVVEFFYESNKFFGFGKKNLSILKIKATELGNLVIKNVAIDDNKKIDITIDLWAKGGNNIDMGEIVNTAPERREKFYGFRYIIRSAIEAKQKAIEAEKNNPNNSQQNISIDLNDDNKESNNIKGKQKGTIILETCTIGPENQNNSLNNSKIIQENPNNPQQDPYNSAAIEKQNNLNKSDGNINYNRNRINLNKSDDKSIINILDGNLNNNSNLKPQQNNPNNLNDDNLNDDDKESNNIKGKQKGTIILEKCIIGPENQNNSQQQNPGFFGNLKKEINNLFGGLFSCRDTRNVNPENEMKL